tara:strand:+ start:57 stop:515 length:459 start_codon:yes stop_codon:yes gene_type:complete
MNFEIQTGTDGNGDPVTTTLNVQFTWTVTYLSHETQNYVNMNTMPQRRQDNMIKKVKVKVSGTDGTTANAARLQSGQADQTWEEDLEVTLPWRAKANGDITGFITPYENVTETMMVNWAKDILINSPDNLLVLEHGWATNLYGRDINNPEPT